MYFQRGLKLDNLGYVLSLCLRAVYFQRGLKQQGALNKALGGLRAVYFQRGLKLLRGIYLWAGV